jgi:hypothetical protein
MAVYRWELRLTEEGLIRAGRRAHQPNGSLAYMSFTIRPGETRAGLPFDDIVALLPAYLEMDQAGDDIGIFAADDPRDGSAA